MRPEMSTQTKTIQTGRAERGKTYDMAYIGIFAVMIAVCSWISIPATVPFTLQTFAEREAQCRLSYIFCWEP